MIGYRQIFGAILLLGGLSSASAGVIVGATRVIYDGSKKEASVSVNNPDAIPYLIQSWVEPSSANGAKAPLLITPPLYRLEKEQRNLMRIILTGELPQDKESLYWLSIKAIPSSPRKENTLQIAIKTRIKLIYRPAKLKEGRPEDYAGELVWQRVDNWLQVTNASAFYINFNEISFANKKLDNVTWVAPGGNTRFALPPGIHGSEVTFKIINDYGGISDVYHASL